MPKVRSSVNHVRIRLALLLLLCFFLKVDCAKAEDNSTFECGRNLFNSAKYKDALPYLKSSQSLYSYDNRAFYYEALCYHRLGQLGAAMTAYQNVIAKFPDSEAAELSKKALAGMRGGSQQSSAGGSLNKLKALAVDKLPAQLILKVPAQDGKPVVEALVSGSKVKFVIDTTVANSVVGIEVAKQSKMPDPAVKSNDEYSFYDIKLDTMTRAAFPLKISSKEPKIAVLGADYFDYATVSYAPPEKATFDGSALSSSIGTLTITRKAGFSNPFESGLKLFNSGKFRAAYPLLKTSSVNRPRDPRALYVLAVCCQHINKLDEARASYRNVIKRFPGTEASSLSNFALLAIDPTYAVQAQAQAKAQSPSAQSKSDKYTLLGGVPQLSKKAEFEIPYTPENGYIRVTALIDGRNVDMYLNNSLGVCVFSSEQIRQVDSSYLENTVESTVKPTDPNNSNNLTQTITRPFRLKRVIVGKIETSNVAAQLVDNTSRIGATWGTSDRPLLGVSAIPGWRYEVLPNRRMLRFIQQN